MGVGIAGLVLGALLGYFSQEVVARMQRRGLEARLAGLEDEIGREITRRAGQVAAVYRQKPSVRVYAHVALTAASYTNYTLGGGHSETVPILHSLTIDSIDFSHEKAGRELGGEGRTGFLINWRYDRFSIAVPLDVEPNAG